MLVKERVLLLFLAESLHAQLATSGLRTRTVTITTTGSTTATSSFSSIDSTPTMFAGQDGYAFQGCFEQSASDDAGKALGYDFIIPANASYFDKLTASLCVELCGSARTASGGTYVFAGVSNGRDCYCGTTISSSTLKDLDNKCPIPCPGDSTQSCGGNGYIAIYALDASHTTEKTVGSANRQASSTPSEEAPTFYAAENAKGDQPSRAPTGPTVAVIASSVSGFILLCALIFIGVKLHRRNKQLQAAGHRRIESQPSVLDDVGERGKSVTFKKRHSILTGGFFPSVKRTTREQNAPRPLDLSGDAGKISGEGDGATTGAEWRLDNTAIKGSGLSPRTPSARENNSMTLPIHQKPETIAQVPGLGDRAWNRRRYSTPFPPKAAKGAVGQDTLAPAHAGPSGQRQSERYVQEGDVPTLPVLDVDARNNEGRGTAQKDSSEPSPPFTLWTLPSTPSLPHFDRMDDDPDKKGARK